MSTAPNHDTVSNPGPDCALLVIDIQNDFTAGGALEVPDGDQIVPLVNQIAANFRTVVQAQDWHPAGHASFASSHPGSKPYDVIELPYGPQVLWPDHCVQGSHGAEFHPGVDLPHAQLIVRKGGNPQVDSYSAFYEADQQTTTGLAGYLREKAITRVYVVGLALDFCVAWTALHARREGFATFVVLDACRAIDSDGSLQKAMDEMQRAGVVFLESGQLLDKA
ncbi:TPA: bifunctional nicotinamidase/pyrazinamidase [Pseudomonas putida]